MSGRTNYTKVQNTDPMQGPAQITGVYEHFDPLVGETRATKSGLEVSGNWVGRTVYVEDVKLQVVWTGTEWITGTGRRPWVDLVYPSGSKWQGYGAKLGYQLHPDKVVIRGTWARNTEAAVFVSGEVILFELPPAIAARISETCYFLAPSTGTAIISVQYAKGKAAAEVKGNSVGAGNWLAFDNWSIPLDEI